MENGFRRRIEYRIYAIVSHMVNAQSKKMNMIRINVGFHGEVDFDNPASVSGVISNNCKILAHQGYRFTILCDSSANLSQKSKAYHNTVIVPFSTRRAKKGSKLYGWWRIGWISQKLIGYPADIIHIHQKCELVLGVCAFMRNHVPIAFHVNSHPDSWEGTRFGRALRRSDLVIASSGFLKSRLIQKYAFINGKVTVVNNGVDTNIFCPEAGRTLDREREFTVFFAGNIWIEKGFDLVLKAARKLGRKATFVIAGNFDPEGNSLHRKFRKESANNMRYVGAVKQEELPAYYASSDVSIVPSKWEEPFGMVVVESMACGTPVIGSKIGGIPELIREGKTGILVPPDSANGLIDAILWCKKNPERIKKMGNEARKSALKYDWGMTARKLNHLYEELAFKKN